MASQGVIWKFTQIHIWFRLQHTKCQGMHVQSDCMFACKGFLSTGGDDRYNKTWERIYSIITQTQTNGVFISSKVNNIVHVKMAFLYNVEITAAQRWMIKEWMESSLYAHSYHSLREIEEVKMEGLNDSGKKR